MVSAGPEQTGPSVLAAPTAGPQRHCSVRPRRKWHKMSPFCCQRSWWNWRRGTKSIHSYYNFQIAIFPFIQMWGWWLKLVFGIFKELFWSLNIGLSVPVILPPRVKLAANIWRKSVLYFFISSADRYPPGYSKCASGLLGTQPQGLGALSQNLWSLQELFPSRESLCQAFIYFSPCIIR